MKKLFAVSILLLLLSFETIFACTIIIPSLRKEFRKANAVFVGKVVKADLNLSIEEIKANIPEDLQKMPNGKITFQVIEKWKGVNHRKEQDYFAVTAFPCGCPGDSPNIFEVGKDYLVFAEKKNFVMVCSADSMNKEWIREKTKRLDSFWFRTWAKIYPF